MRQYDGFQSGADPVCLQAVPAGAGIDEHLVASAARVAAAHPGRGGDPLGSIPV